MKKQKILVFIVFLTMVMSLFTGCANRYPLPSIKKAEFDFSITYEVNGEATTYAGVYVCEYEGMHVTFVGKGRDWKGYMKDGGGTDIAIATNDLGVIYLSLDFYPEYFMADPDYQGSEAPEPFLYLLYYSEDPDVYEVDRESDFMAMYGVRIISYTFPQPIDNQYEEKLTVGRFEPSIN